MPQPSRRPQSRQAELFARPKRATIQIAPTHRLVMITDETDWTQLEEIVQEIRRRKLKNEAGRPPHLRALIGALVFRALRRMTYRETEDQIRHICACPGIPMASLQRSTWRATACLRSTSTRRPTVAAPARHPWSAARGTRPTSCTAAHASRRGSPGDSATEPRPASMPPSALPPSGRCRVRRSTSRAHSARDATACSSRDVHSADRPARKPAGGRELW
jgi:hypothetical protein